MITTCGDCTHLEIHIYTHQGREIGRCRLGHYDGLHAPVTLQQWYAMNGITRGRAPTRAIAEKCDDRVVRP